jgi:hypothetical protein
MIAPDVPLPVEQSAPPAKNPLPDWITSLDVPLPVEQSAAPAGNSLPDWITAPDAALPAGPSAPPAKNPLPEWLTAPEVLSQCPASPPPPVQNSFSEWMTNFEAPPAPTTQSPVPSWATSHDVGYTPPIRHEFLDRLFLDVDDQAGKPRVAEPVQRIADCITIPGNNCCQIIAVTPASIHADLVDHSHVDDVLDEIKRGKPLRAVFGRRSLAISFDKIYSFDCNQKDDFLRIFWTDDRGATTIESAIDCGDAAVRMRVIRLLQDNLGELWVRRRMRLKYDAIMAGAGGASVTFALLTTFFIFCTGTRLTINRFPNHSLLQLAELIGGPSVAALVCALVAVGFFGWMLFTLANPPTIVRIRPRALLPH